MKKHLRTWVPYIFFLFLLNATNNTFAIDRSTIDKVKAFVPEDYEVLEMASGDLNGDKYKDYVLILKNKNETNNRGLARPLIIIKGYAKGKLELMARNDQVVLCSNCAGVFGDPTPKIILKERLLTIETNVGTNWKYTRIITFKYDADLEELMLHKDSNISYHVSSPNRKKDSITNQDDFDKLLFTDYTYNKGF